MKRYASFRRSVRRRTSPVKAKTSAGGGLDAKTAGFFFGGHVGNDHNLVSLGFPLWSY